MIQLIRYSPILLSSILVLFLLGTVGAMVLPIAVMTLGFLLLGYVLPELLESVTPYSKTIWMPIGFLVAALAGMYLVFGGSTLQVILTPTWCPIAPCINIGIVLVSFILGNVSRFAASALSGQKLDLFGEDLKG